MKIAVIGSGGWGLAMAKSMAEKGHAVTVWSHRTETTAMLRENRCNPKLLKGVSMPESIDFTDDIGCVAGCPIVVVAVPSFAVCETARMMKPHLAEGQVLVLLSKGFDLKHDCCLLSETLAREVGKNCPVVALTPRRSAGASPPPCWRHPLTGRRPNWCRMPCPPTVSGCTLPPIW